MTAGSAAAEPLAGPGPAADPQPVADPAGALAEVIACAGRTLGVPSARIEIRADTDLGRIRAHPAPPPRARGQARRAHAWRILARVAPDMDSAELREQFLHQFGAGFLAAAARYLIDYGGWAQVLVDGRRFSGLSGEALGPRYENRPGRSLRGDPLDALRRLQGATAARWIGDETVRCTPCRVAVTTAGADEFTVWVDDRHSSRR